MKWTKRKNGQIMCTIHVRVHIPQDLIDWLTEHTTMGRTESMKWVRENFNDLTMESWDVLMSDGDSATIVRDTEKDQAEEDGYLRYDGPPVLLS